jgi:hypothetical protein
MSQEPKFPRYCSITGDGMYHGYCIDDGMYYASTLDALLKVFNLYYGIQLDINDDELMEQLDHLYDEGLYYHSEWTDEDIDNHED